MRDYEEIWVWLASVNLGLNDEADCRLRRHFFEKPIIRRDGFPKKIARFLLGEIELEELLESAKSDDPVKTKDRVSVAAFYSAQVCLMAEGREAIANQLLDLCLKMGLRSSYEYHAAAIQKIVLAERL